MTLSNSVTIWTESHNSIAESRIDSCSAVMPGLKKVITAYGARKHYVQTHSQVRMYYVACPFTKCLPKFHKTT